MGGVQDASEGHGGGVQKCWGEEDGGGQAYRNRRGKGVNIASEYLSTYFMGLSDCSFVMYSLYTRVCS